MMSEEKKRLESRASELEKLIEANLVHPDRKLAVDYSIVIADQLKTLLREYQELTGKEYDVYSRYFVRKEYLTNYLVIRL